VAIQSSGVFFGVIGVFCVGAKKTKVTSFFISKPSDRQRAHIAIDKAELPLKVTLRKGGRRSTEQNAYLWGCCYETILEHGLKEQGFEKEDVHEYFLGEYHGWETKELFGMKRKKPIERSSGKTKAEFADYIDFIHRKAAEMGVYIPSPEES
jgi:hypothetical protein